MYILAVTFVAERQLPTPLPWWSRGEVAPTAQGSSGLGTTRRAQPERQAQGGLGR
jgi:hypothetical protein